MDPYKDVTELTNLWVELESLVKTLVVNDPACPLNSGRYHDGKVRLFYNEKPLSECKAQEKIEAVQFVPAFLVLWKAEREKMTRDATDAVIKLRAYVEVFKKEVL